MTNLDRVLKSKDITLLTKVCIVKAMVFPVPYQLDCSHLEKCRVTAQFGWEQNSDDHGCIRIMPAGAFHGLGH